MTQNIALTSLIVKDYDEAIRFFVDKLGFELTDDVPLPKENTRWVTVSPTPDSAARLLLARAKNEQERSRIGNQTGGRVFLFLHTDNFKRDYQRYQANGVIFKEQPRTEAYGTVAVFEDLYGNLWDLLEPS